MKSDFFSGLYTRALTKLVTGLGIVSGVSILFMIVFPVVDVLLRLVSLFLNLFKVFGTIAFALPGAYDLVKIAGVLSLAAGIPYVTAVKGHVAIELVIHKLPPLARQIVNVIVNLATIAFFAVVCYQSVIYGFSLLKSGEVSNTLQVPIFWIPFVLSFCSVIVVLVLFHVMIHPGKELLKP